MKITIEIDGVKKEISIPLLYDRDELETELCDAQNHADGWEKRCAELEQENRELKEILDDAKRRGYVKDFQL